ncbi:MAG: ABC-three component system middle component 5, partial [Pseudomonadota bacterium]|nr:ABC-three component system middle component 5 [Pseudomonadota bacterium]
SPDPWNNALSTEPLYSMHFQGTDKARAFLVVCNSPLLHKTTMSHDARKKFNLLKVVRPEKAFVSFPAAPLLFNRMAAVQKEAVATLAGKAALNLIRLPSGYVRLTDAGVGLARDIRDLGTTKSEQQIIEFVAETFSASSIPEITALRRNVGLRRMTV